MCTRDRRERNFELALVVRWAACATLAIRKNDGMRTRLAPAFRFCQLIAYGLTAALNADAVRLVDTCAHHTGFELRPELLTLSLLLSDRVCPGQLSGARKVSRSFLFCERCHGGATKHLGPLLRDGQIFVSR